MVINNLNAGELYEKYSGHVKKVISRYIPNQDDQKDLLQNVFVKVLDNIEKGKGAITNEGGWVYKIAQNTCLDYLKARKRSKEIRFSNLNEESSNFIERVAEQDTFPVPDQKSFCRQRDSLLEREIEKLPETLKETIILHYHLEKSVPEIVDLKSISRGTVYFRLNKAAKILRKKLKNRNADYLLSPSK